MDNANSKEYLDKIRVQVIENLKRTAFAPSVQMTDVPREPLVDGMDDEGDAILDDLDEDENKDKRFTRRRFDQYVEKDGELSESEDEEEAAANGVRPQQNGLKRRNQVNYRTLDLESGVESGVVTPREESSMPDEEPALADKMEDVQDSAAQEKQTSEPPTRPESTAELDDAAATEPNGAPGSDAEDALMDEEEPKDEEQEEMEGDEERAATPITSNGVTGPHDTDVDTTMEEAPETLSMEPPVPSGSPGQGTPPRTPESAARSPQVANPPAEPESHTEDNDNRHNSGDDETQHGTNATSPVATDTDNPMAESSTAQNG